jgi:hypothetical protein
VLATAAVLDSVVLGSAVLRSAVLGSAVLGSAVLGSAVLGSALLDSALLFPPAEAAAFLLVLFFFRSVFWDEVRGGSATGGSIF